MNPSHRPLRIGNFEIPEPCPVPWDEMRPEGVNKHCLRCNKVVHDLTGMSISEIERLFEANGGRLCGSFAVDGDGNPIYYRGEQGKRKPVYLKHIAAAASMLLLYQFPQAKPIAVVKPRVELALPGNRGPSTVPTEKTNTLVTGMVLTEYGDETHDSLLVKIKFEGKTIASAYTSSGLFHFDLADKLRPEDVITITVSGKTFDPGVKYRERKYGSAQQSTSLGKAQNVALKVDYQPAERPPYKGGMVRRPLD